MDPNVILKWLPEAIILLLTNVGTYVFMKRRRVAKTEQEENLANKGELENVQLSLSLYREMMGDLRDQLKRANDTYHKLEAEFDKIVEKEKQCRKEIEAKKREIERLRKENLSFYRKVDTCPHDCSLSEKNNKKK